MKFNKVVIIGIGLIGGSLGKVILKKGLAGEVVGLCRRQSSLDKALAERSISRGYVNDYERALENADLVVIATPVETIKEAIKNIANIVKDKNVLVTDVGSTKQEIVKYAGKFKKNFTFIGAHPLAGSEKTGVESSSDDLFVNSVCILTPEKDADKELVAGLEALWGEAGSRVYILSPSEHDGYIAFSSHLPHMVSFALAGSLEKDFPLYMIASGFKDTTRIAASDAYLWTEIFMTNRANILRAVKRFKKNLSFIEQAIKEKKKDKLENRLKDIRDARVNISKNKNAVAIDGPAGSGKSTVSRLVAEKLGFIYVDTGAMYRALTVKIMRNDIGFNDENKIVELSRDLDISFLPPKKKGASMQVFLSGSDVTEEIRKINVSGNVKYAARIPAVRENLVKLQRQMVSSMEGAVMEGRDIGTVVLRDAKYKFYLDADFDERVKRRLLELESKGEKVSRKEVADDLKQRDLSDMSRKVGPLRKAEDAILLDTTDLTIAEVVDKIVTHIKKNK